MRNDWRRWTWVGPLALSWILLPGCQSPPPPIDYAKLYNTAYSQLVHATVDDDAHIRSKAMEALPVTLGNNAGPLLMEGLRDPMGPVIFAAAMGVGEVKYMPARPLLLAMAKDPQAPPKLLCAILYALHRLGDDTYTGQLAVLLIDRDKWVRSTAAMILGRMGEPSAIEPIKSLLREDHDPVVQLQGYEALCQLGDERSVSLLEAFTKGQFLEDRIIAIQALGKLGNARGGQALMRLLEDNKQDPVIRVAAAGALARMHNRTGYKLVLEAAADPTKVLRTARGSTAAISPQETISMQTLAVLALGHMENTEALPVLQPLVYSPNGAVRVAACEAVMQLLQSYQISLSRIEPAKPSSATTTAPAEGAALPAAASASQPAAETHLPSGPAPAAVEATDLAPAPTPAPTAAEPPAVTEPSAASAPAVQGEEPARSVEDLLNAKNPSRLKRAGAKD